LLTLLYFQSSPDDFNHINYSLDDFENLDWMRYVPSKKSFYLVGEKYGTVEIGKISLK
tara:strand:- start:345 stop:518 length:174 start_codon:yes stop_codon:yes gene_type:complete